MAIGAFVTLVSSVIIGDTFIGMAKELDARRKEKACKWNSVY